MIKSEYVRNLNRNFERIQLEEDMDCKRYQYCILFRGGIKYLLPCSYQQIDSCNYLYYDITSSQNLRQMFAKKAISREWMKAFLWSIQRMRQELNRFLLDEKNIIWSSDHIFQDLEKNDFRYIYIPYYGQENSMGEGFNKLIEFWIDKVDYEDTALVEFVYHAYEQLMTAGQCYLEQQIFEDFTKKMQVEDEELPKGASKCTQNESDDAKEGVPELQDKKGLRLLLGRNRRKPEQKNIYREEIKQMINGYAVCEETKYNEKIKEEVEVQAEEFGRTIYIEEKEEIVHGLYSEKGELRVRFDKFPFVVGKRREDVDYVLPDYSTSRVHARFIEEEDGVYLEDLNSTNGTYKNGLRMQPYEKRKLEQEDSLRFGKSVFIYK